MGHAGIHGPGSLYALRVLIGAAEAGFTPVAMYYMSTLYPKYDLAFRLGMFAGMYSVAGAFAGVIAYGLLKVDNASVKGWQAVFLVEGGVTVFMAVVSFLMLPKKIDTAWFLTPEERLHAVRRMELDLAGTQEGAEISGKGVTKRDVLDVARDWKKLLTIVCNIFCVLPVTGFTTFLPLVVQGLAGPPLPHW